MWWCHEDPKSVLVSSVSVDLAGEGHLSASLSLFLCVFVCLPAPSSFSLFVAFTFPAHSLFDPFFMLCLYFSAYSPFYPLGKMNYISLTFPKPKGDHRLCCPLS